MEEQKSDVMVRSKLGDWIAKFYGQDTSMTGKRVSEKFDRELKCNVGPLDEDNGDIQKEEETTGRTVGKKPVNAEDNKNLMRPVVQMIPANNSMRSQHNIMPDAKSQIEKLSGCKYFSLLDFSNFYFQIGVSEQYTRDVGLISSHGIFDVHRLIQGEKNSSFTASKLGKALQYNLPFIANLLDDFIIGQKPGGLFEHLLDLEQFKKNLCYLSEADDTMKIRADKLVLLADEIEFCGVRLRDGLVSHFSTPF